MRHLLHQIAEKENFQLQAASPLGGGDINEVYGLETNAGKRVIKINSADKFPGMFEKEAKGLNLLRKAESFTIPHVYGCGQVGTHSYLLMENLPTGQKDQNFWKDFARNLAKLHQVSNPTFGLDHDNYIGSLPQYNTSTTQKAGTFYIENRLEPQFHLAGENGYSFKALDRFYRRLEDLIPEGPPALVHGDLWGGNYMVIENALPALIDPAVGFAPREMDIGMMSLFGGFSKEVFSHYQDIFPMENGWKNRLEIWQLYYLLVHLNLFGTAYLSPVKRIITRFT